MGGSKKDRFIQTIYRIKQLFLRDIGFTAIVVGLSVEIIGLGLDAALHAFDETLAAREGIFTLSNPGHLLFFAGLASTIIGVLIHIASLRVRAHWMGVGVLLALGIVAALALNAQALASPSHDHPYEIQDSSATITHTHGNEINIGWEQLQEIDRMLGETKSATAKYRDVQVAYAEDYRQEGSSRPGEGAHFINRKILDVGVFDLAHPTFLLYEHQPDWSYELVGVGWLLPKPAGDETPPAYFSPLAAWHYHAYPPPGLCIWQDGTTNPLDETTCNSGGGRYWAESPWMLHVWLYRPSPEGIFSLVNSAVKGIQSEEISTD